MTARSRITKAFIAVVLFSRLSLLAQVVPAATSDLRTRLHGAWERKDGEEFLNFQDDRVIALQDGRLGMKAVLKSEPDGLLVRSSGVVEHWRAVLTDQGLSLDRDGSSSEFRRLDRIPPSLELQPLHLPVPQDLAADRTQAIQKEISERLRTDQSVLKDASADKSMIQKVIAENTKFLRGLVGEVGWIDAKRFGSKTSYDAVILAKHSGDLSLLLSALPLIERDFKHSGDDAAAFAIVYDSIQLDLGGKQRYGTQLREGKDGKPFVLALEDPARVDEFRREIALPPLSEYLELASKYLFDGKPVTVPKAESR